MKYEEMPYSRIDFAEETKALKELMEEFQTAKSAEEQFRVHQKYYERTRHIQTEMALASTRNSLDTSDTFYDQEKEYYDREYPAYSNLAVEYAKLLLKSPFRRELEEKIGYNFKDSHLLRHAVTHSSYVNEKHMKKADCNERLEFLGDAVLELISSEYLFFENQTMPEGELTKLRASMVCEKALAFCARDLELGSYLLLGKGEDATGGRFRESITSDALEALIGAIYLDGGFANAKEFILKYILNDLEGKRLFYDSKTILQEMVQGGQEKGIVYQLVGEEGPDHNKSFRVEVLIGGEAFGCGIGRTKKAAEQEAAYQAILKLKEGKVQ